MPLGCDGLCNPLEDLEGLLAFLREWKWGAILGDLPAEPLARQGIEDRVAHRVHTDERFRQMLLAEPRRVYIIALAEGLGLGPLFFFCEIREVRVLEETREILYLALPSHDFGSPAATLQGPGRILSRQDIEHRIVARASNDKDFRQSLLFQPNSTYRRSAQELCAGQLPPYLLDVKEIRVVPETQSSILFVLPLHDPLACPAAPESESGETAIAEAVGLLTSIT